MYDVDMHSGENGETHLPMSEDEDYELFYGTGGHGGPLHGITEARRAAMRHLRGSQTEQTVYIVPRQGRPFGIMGAVLVIDRRSLAPESPAQP